jgi:beta-glucosidase
MVTGSETAIRDLLSRMTLREKIGQMCQVTSPSERGEQLIRDGGIGSFLNVVDRDTCDRYQRIAREESRLGIPLIMGRDVIHGFRTVFPIPLGQAASWNMSLIRDAARISAVEAASCGVNWTFAPMIDIARDPRWGRVAEGAGEDTHLASTVGVAMVEGFQGPDLSAPDAIAACAKHYVGYGAAEGGRDYNTTDIPERALRDIYLPPFEACVDAGVATLMSAFNEIDGVPATGNAFALSDVLRGEWGFDGFVVSDYNSVTEMVAHGSCEDDREAACQAVTAGVDMEMVSESYREHVEGLVSDGAISMAVVDEAVLRILRVKARLGLFAESEAVAPAPSAEVAQSSLEAARTLARESIVLLENDGVLPIAANVGSVAVVGPLADAPADQLGCWVMDGRPDDSVAPLDALRERLGEDRVLYAPGLDSSRDTHRTGFATAAQAARDADVVVAFVGEEAILSGEAHSRAFLDLPGAQNELLEALADPGTPIVVVVLAGRPLTMGAVASKASAVLMAWHPGTMAGPAIADILFGDDTPSGKLPISFPKTVGQIPIYYAHKNTGRPPSAGAYGIPLGTPLDPVDFTTGYLDADPEPLYPFGYGMSYTQFEYSDLEVSVEQVRLGGSVSVSATLRNVGDVAGVEVAQLYVRDVVGSVTRPVRELKGFQRRALEPGEGCTVTFELWTDALAFHGRDMRRVTEAGEFHVWIGGSAKADLRGTFHVVD